jgi:hypothetical protein
MTAERAFTITMPPRTVTLSSLLSRQDEIVPAGLRMYLRWDHRHDAMAEKIMLHGRDQARREKSL